MRARAGFLLLLAATLLTGIAGAQAGSPSAIPYYTYPSYGAVCSPNGQASVAGPNPAAIVSLTFVALDVAFSLLALGYIFGRLVPAAGIQNWLRGEYFELTKSILIVVSIYAIITIVSGIGLTLAYNPNPVTYQTGATTTTYTTTAPSGSLIPNVGTLISESEEYLCEASNYVKSGWTFIGEESLAIGMLQNMLVGIYLPIPVPLPWGGFAITDGFQMKPYQNFMLESGNVVIQHFESSIFDLVQFVLFPVAAMIAALISLMPFIVSLGLTVLIPFGLIMRAFPFVRGVGGTLIAIGIGASVVFPTILILVDQPITVWSVSLIPEPGTISASSCHGLGTIFCHIGTFIESTLGQTGQLFKYGLEAFGSIYPFFNETMQSSFFDIVQLLLFAADLIIIYQVTDSVARILGGSIRLSLGNKLKMA